MLYGEIEVKPLQIDIDSCFFTYWAKPVAPTYNKCSVLMYKSMLSSFLQMEITNTNSFKWICYVFYFSLLEVWPKNCSKNEEKKKEKIFD